MVVEKRFCTLTKLCLIPSQDLTPGTNSNKVPSSISTLQHFRTKLVIRQCDIYALATMAPAFFHHSIQVDTLGKEFSFLTSDAHDLREKCAKSRRLNFVSVQRTGFFRQGCRPCDICLSFDTLGCRPFILFKK